MRTAFILFLVITTPWLHAQKQMIAEWKFTTSAPIIGSPTLFKNMILFGSTDSNFYALDAENGKQLWKFRTKGQIRSSCAIADDKIFINGGDGNLYCLKENGQQAWMFRTSGENTYPLYSFADYFHSSPLYDNGTVFFGSGDSCVYALDAANGKLKWKYKTLDIVHASPAVSGNNIFIGSFDGYFYSLNKETGKLNWKFKSIGQQYFPKGEFNGSATVSGKTVFVGNRDYNFYALDTATGTALWNLRFQRGWAITKPLMNENKLYIGTSDDKSFLALDPQSGNTLWKFDAKYNMFGAPRMYDSTVFIGTMMGNLWGLNKNTGSILSKFITEGSSKNRKKYFKEDETYIDNIFGTVIKKNEDFLNLYTETGGIISQPLIYRDRLYVTSMDGNLYCIRLK